MRECGADLSAHRARPIDDTLLCGADCFAVMSASHAAALAAYGVPPERVHVLAAQSGGIPDPYGGSLDDYRRTRDILKDAVEALAVQCSALKRNAIRNPDQKGLKILWTTPVPSPLRAL